MLNRPGLDCNPPKQNSRETRKRKKKAQTKEIGMHPLGKHTGTRLAGERGAPVLFGQTGRPLVESRSQRLARRKGRLETTAGPKSSIGRIAAPQSLNQKIWDTPAIDEIRPGVNQMNSQAYNFLDFGHAANGM